ncbi:Transferase protein [Dioscorea alata]|uniref:Transferase protein n=1 Tax=Dioscorea alata TaxID=55571 RepID=A0ACB7UCT1_DIOAL|nr:Transferase protein [Dioscorea alata]
MPSSPAMVTVISKCTVKAEPPPKLLANKKCHLTPWDLAMLSPQYIQKGHLFTNLPPTFSIDDIISNLKTSLSSTLHHFYPLAGRLATQHEVDNDGNITGTFVFIDCNNEGAEFVHADAQSISVEDVLAPFSDVPAFVQSFFPYDGATNHDGHCIPLVAVQLTVLADGVFLGCSFNHAVGDGTSFWHFFTTWAEICRSKNVNVFPSRPPIHDRCFLEGAKPPLKLPFTHESQFIERHYPPPLREKMFHFSSEAIAKLKAKANKECGTDKISSFQSLSALMWRCITRARRFPAEQVTSCRVAIQNRARLQPSQSPNYFGNSIYSLRITATAGELLENDFGWAAWVIHEGVVSHTNDAIRGMVKRWVEAPVVYKLSMFDNFSVVMGSSPRFDMYGCDFGWGKAVALRSGSANKSDGKVSSYPGWEGGGSVDLEVCLPAKSMATLEADPEFLAAVSPFVPLHVQTSQVI